MSNLFEDSEFDNFGIKDSHSSNTATTSYQKIKYLGGSKQAWPMRVRLLINPHHPAERKHTHETITHAKNFNGRWVIANCPRTIKSQCPICDKYYELINKVKDKKQSGAPASEIKAIEDQAAWYKPKKSISVLAVESGGTEIKLYNMGVKLAEQLFGKNEIRGTLDDFKEMGVKWYNPTETMGWIEIQRSGSKLDTVYRAEPWQVVNKQTRSKVPVEEALSPEVVSQINDPVNMYRIHENFVKFIWPIEELEAYVNSGLSVLPDRVAKMLKIDQKFKSAPVGDEDVLPSSYTPAPKAPVAGQRPAFQATPVSNNRPSYQTSSSATAYQAPARTAPAAPQKAKAPFDDDDIPF